MPTEPAIDPVARLVNAFESSARNRGLDNKEHRPEATGSQPVDATENKDVTVQQLSSMLAAVEQTINQFHPNSINFEVNADSGKVIIRVIDSETDEVIRQLPPESMVKAAEHIAEYQMAIGMIVDETA